jgi:hypothetical protein
MEDLKVLATALNNATKKGAFNLDEATVISKALSSMIEAISKCENCESCESCENDKE